jgi:hypothetical protein
MINSVYFAYFAVYKFKPTSGAVVAPLVNASDNWLSQHFSNVIKPAAILEDFSGHNRSAQPR